MTQRPIQAWNAAFEHSSVPRLRALPPTAGCINKAGLPTRKKQTFDIRSVGRTASWPQVSRVKNPASRHQFRFDPHDPRRTEGTGRSRLSPPAPAGWPVLPLPRAVRSGANRGGRHGVDIRTNPFTEGMAGCRAYLAAPACSRRSGALFVDQNLSSFATVVRPLADQRSEMETHEHGKVPHEYGVRDE